MASEGVAFQTSHPFPREVEPLHVSDHIMEEGAWNKPKMERVLWEEDRRIIQSIPIIQTLVPHSWCWQYSRIGSFTTKSAYKLYIFANLEAFSSSLGMHEVWWKQVWGSSLSSKIKIFFDVFIIIFYLHPKILFIENCLSW